MIKEAKIEDFTRQLKFIREVDKIKSIFRQTPITDKTRKENDAEHSWHLALMAIILEEYAPKKINILKVIKMVIIHDIVEIDAGDTYLFDDAGYTDKAEREEKAARRIFGILPKAQADQFKALWNEFEKRKTAEANFANMLDRIQPFILNIATEGISWKEHGIMASQVISKIKPAIKDYPVVLDYFNKNLQIAIEKSWLINK